MLVLRSLAVTTLVALVLVCGCESDGGSTGPDSPDLPDPFDLLSEYFGAPVAPPYHYDFSILVSRASADTIIFYPDYQESDPPVWVEEFDAAQVDLESLHTLMVGEEVFRDSWTVMEHPPMGASSRRLTGIAGELSIAVPSWVVDTAATRPVYEAIDALVPTAVWDSLWARRDRFIRDYGAG